MASSAPTRFVLAHMPAELRVVDVWLFDLGRSPSLAATLRSAITTAARQDDDAAGRQARAAVDFAFIDARMITSTTHLLAAVHFAITQAALGQLHSHTVHSEILFALNPTQNVGEAMRRFGLSDSSSTLLLVHVGPEDVDCSTAVASLVPTGRVDPLPLDRLGSGADIAAIRKAYKLNDDRALQGLPDDRAFSTVDSIVSSLVGARAVG